MVPLDLVLGYVGPGALGAEKLIPKVGRSLVPPANPDLVAQSAVLVP